MTETVRNYYGKKEEKKCKKRNARCEDCANLIPIGEGDHVCYECGEPVLPVSGYAPTEDYLKCSGRKYERN